MARNGGRDAEEIAPTKKGIDEPVVRSTLAAGKFLWDPSTGKLPATVDSGLRLRAGAWTPDSKTFITTNQKNYDSENAEQKPSHHLPNVICIGNAGKLRQSDRE